MKQNNMSYDILHLLNGSKGCHFNPLERRNQLNTYRAEETKKKQATTFLGSGDLWNQTCQVFRTSFIPPPRPLETSASGKQALESLR